MTLRKTICDWPLARRQISFSRKPYLALEHIKFSRRPEIPMPRTQRHFPGRYPLSNRYFVNRSRAAFELCTANKHEKNSQTKDAYCRLPVHTYVFVLLTFLLDTITNMAAHVLLSSEADLLIKTLDASSLDTVGDKRY